MFFRPGMTPEELLWGDDLDLLRGGYIGDGNPQAGPSSRETAELVRIALLNAKSGNKNTVDVTNKLQEPKNGGDQK